MPAAATEITYDKTPGYMQDGRLAAHAMGALDGRAYTNSLEAFKQNYAAGYRLFEVDLQLTSDNKLITIHESHRISQTSTFKQEQDNVPFTIMTFEELCLLMLEYDDFYIITDTKYTDNRQNKIIFDVIAETIKRTDPELLKRVVIQFYNPQMYYFLCANYPFLRDNYMYTLYMSPDSDSKVIDFVRRARIRAVVMWDFRADKNFVADLVNSGAAVYAHTVNDINAALELYDNGVYGIYTDTLDYEKFAYSRIGRFLPFDKPSQSSEASVTRAINAGLVPRFLQVKYAQPINRAEFCALAVAFYETVTGAEIAGRAAFTDTTDTNVEKAAYLGLVGGVGGGEFDPYAPLGQERAAAILARLADAAGKPLNIKAAENIVNSIAGDPYTREQAIVTMLRFYNAVIKI